MACKATDSSVPTCESDKNRLMNDWVFNRHGLSEEEGQKY